MKIEGQIQGYTLTNDELDGSDGVIESMEKVVEKKDKGRFKNYNKEITKRIKCRCNRYIRIFI